MHRARCDKTGDVSAPTSIYSLSPFIACSGTEMKKMPRTSRPTGKSLAPRTLPPSRVFSALGGKIQILKTRGKTKCCNKP